MIPTFEELLASLPEEERTPEVIEGLRRAYDEEMEMINHHALKCEKPNNGMQLFRRADTQYIAEFWVNDLGIPRTNQENWHGQNTSQWKYAGCILVEKGKVSRHH